MAYFVYILRCGDDSLYTGSTNDVARRLGVHQSGKGAKYTRSRPPVTLAYQETLPDRSAALRREAEIKGLSREKKLELIRKGKTTMIPMRRKDRERPAEFAWGVVDTCEYAFLSMLAEDATPYGLPVTIVRDGNCVYFHGAMAGRKADCLRKNPRVCLTCVGETEMVQAEFTTLFSSAVAFGTAVELEGESEKIAALRLLCQRHTPDAMADFDGAVAQSIAHTAVWKITVEEISGKQKTR
ncbi:MAG: pyridoxamine 5'-phosphate oxidase family protein [Oscillibacter sp.]